MSTTRKAQRLKTWMKVSRDALELPEAVAGSAPELARILGIKENTIYKSMNRAKNSGGKSCYISVQYEDDDDDS